MFAALPAAAATITPGRRASTTIVTSVPDSTKVPLAGGTMTGTLIMSSAPVSIVGEGFDFRTMSAVRASSGVFTGEVVAATVTANYAAIAGEVMADTATANYGDIIVVNASTMTSGYSNITAMQGSTIVVTGLVSGYSLAIATTSTNYFGLDFPASIMSKTGATYGNLLLTNPLGESFIFALQSGFGVAAIAHVSDAPWSLEKLDGNGAVTGNIDQYKEGVAAVNWTGFGANNASLIVGRNGKTFTMATDSDPVLMFGGMYSIRDGGGCDVANPLSSICTCSSGFTGQVIAGAIIGGLLPCVNSVNTDCKTVYCWRN